MLAGGRHTTIPHESPAPPHPYGTDKSVPYSRERIYAFRNPPPRKEHPLWNLFLMSSLIWY